MNLVAPDIEMRDEVVNREELQTPILGAQLPPEDILWSNPQKSEAHILVIESQSPILQLEQPEPKIAKTILNLKQLQLKKREHATRNTTDYTTRTHVSTLTKKPKHHNRESIG